MRAAVTSLFLCLGACSHVEATTGDSRPVGDTEHGTSVTTAITPAPLLLASKTGLTGVPDPKHVPAPPQSSHSITLQDDLARFPGHSLEEAIPPRRPAHTALSPSSLPDAGALGSVDGGGFPVGTVLPAAVPAMPTATFQPPPLDPPAPAQAICAAVPANDDKCDTALPHAYDCPRSAQPIGCAPMRGVVNLADRREECCP